MDELVTAPGKRPLVVDEALARRMRQVLEHMEKPRWARVRDAERASRAAKDAIDGVPPPAPPWLDNHVWKALVHLGFVEAVPFGPGQPQPGDHVGTSGLGDLVRLQITARGRAYLHPVRVQ